MFVYSYLAVYLFLALLVVNNQHLFLKISDVYYHNTRHRTNFHVPPTRLTMAQKGVLYSGITLFNELPDEIKKFSDTPKIFKRNLKSFLINQALYNLQEFSDLRNSKL